jgi:hypothetical protein
MNAGSIFCTGPTCFLQASFFDNAVEKEPKKEQKGL